MSGNLRGTEIFAYTKTFRDSSRCLNFLNCDRTMNTLSMDAVTWKFPEQSCHYSLR